MTYSPAHVKVRSLFTTMKVDIHPNYNSSATIACACGQKFTVGSTQDHTDVELCSNCHPFYTGKQKIVDTARRVEKFEKRMGAKADAVRNHQAKLEKKAKRAQAKQEKREEAEKAEMHKK